VRICALEALPRLASGKVDDAAIRRLATDAGRLEAECDEAAVDDPVGVRSLYAEVLGHVAVDDDATFVGLGGDSLSYVEVSVRLEDLLGTLPPAWHLRPVRELEALVVPRRRLKQVETNVVLRAVAIVMVVGTHAGLFEQRGGAHVLLAIAGFNVARFQLGARDAGTTARRVLAAAARVALPSMAWIALLVAVTDGYGLANVVLLNGHLGALDFDERWRFWFIEVLVQGLLVVAALFAVPGVRRLEARRPFGFAVGIVLVALALRHGLVEILDARHRTVQPQTIVWVLALGWAAQRAATVRQRLVVSALVVAAVPGFFYGEPVREAVIVGGVLALLWLPMLAIPRPLDRVAAPVAGASLAIYLTHWHVFPLVGDRSTPLAATLASVRRGRARHCVARPGARRRCGGDGRLAGGASSARRRTRAAAARCARGVVHGRAHDVRCTRAASRSATVVHAPTGRSARTPTMAITRRGFLLGQRRAAGAPRPRRSAAAVPATRPARSRTATARALRTDPFTLGVASGDPLPTAVGAVDPARPPTARGRRACRTRPVVVRWQVSTDESFRGRSVVRHGVTMAEPASGTRSTWTSTACRPGARVLVPLPDQPLGQPGRPHRDRPRPGASPASLAFAFASCQHWETGYYTAYRDMAEQTGPGRAPRRLHLRERAKDPASKPGTAARAPHNSPEIYTSRTTATGTRCTAATPNLQLVHQRFPWVVTWDDHEVDNDHAGLVSDKPADQAIFAERRASAYQVYYEHMPIRRRPSGPDLELYRNLRFGDLLNLHVLDTRQYRSDQPCGGEVSNCDERLAESQTMTGADRSAGCWRAWRPPAPAGTHSPSRRSSPSSTSTPSSRARSDGGAVQPDQWDGYAAQRRRSQTSWPAAARPANTVVLTGDFHASFVNDVKVDYDDPGRPPSPPSSSARRSAPTSATRVDRTGGDRHQLARQRAHQGLRRAPPRLRRLPGRPGHVDVGLPHRVDHRAADRHRVHQSGLGRGGRSTGGGPRLTCDHEPRLVTEGDAPCPRRRVGPWGPDRSPRPRRTAPTDGPDARGPPEVAALRGWHRPRRQPATPLASRRAGAGAPVNAPGPDPSAPSTCSSANAPIGVERPASPRMRRRSRMMRRGPPS
jgi:phosphodiesterase/alkaline phosphatase D-like protein/acyl carrier protein